MSGIEIFLTSKYGFVGVFIVTLLSYSIIPFPSEAAIISASFFISPIGVILTALAGSTIGSFTNYYLGKKGVRIFIKKKYNAKKDSKWYKKAKKLFEKFGLWSIFLFGDFPLIGDPLMIIAGSLNIKMSKVLALSIMGRLIYFTIIVYIGKGFEALIIG